jgi:hypothetical protein
VRTAASIPDLDRFRERFPVEARTWVAAGDDPVRRRRAAAAFVLELTRVRLESDWGSLRDLVEWTCAELRAAGAPDDFERAWHEASLALAGRARDRVWLLGDVPYLPGQKAPRPRRDPISPAHLLHAFERLPDSPHIRLEWITAWTWGRDRQPTRNVGLDGEAALFARRDRQQTALAALQILHDDPAVGAEATLRIAYVQFLLGHFADARKTAATVATGRTPDVHYLAEVIAAQASEALSQPDAARAAYERAVQAFPAGESASLALAVYRLTGDDRGDAAALAENSLVRTREGDDPWRLFLYGSFRHWPQRLRTLRAEAQK